MNGLTIGEIAERANVNLQTIRYYEKRALVPKPPRTYSNYRIYPEDTVRRVRFIKHAQKLGFTLAEIKELLSLRAAPKTRCADVRERAEAKVQDINVRIRALQGMRRALTKLIGECSGEGPATECPILDALDHSEVES